jgi:exopolyphosphatase/guanosine-5'-triphosphate,3'-diphosphate pyrophosphatase
MDSRIAIIDLGTNTFHLLIVDLNKSGYRFVYRERESVKIGKHGINKGIITDAALQRALKTISSFKQSIDEMKVQKVYAFGTSALRNAKNCQVVLDRIKNEYGFIVKVISGGEEARLIYLGVKTAVKLGNEKSLIIDIGGGSVEFIIGNDSEIFWKHSFEIGAQRLLEEFHKNDPIKPSEIKALNEHFDSLHPSLFEALQIHRPTTLVGSSGTFDTLSDIYCLKRGLPKDNDAPETPLSFDGFHEIYEELVVKNRADRMKIPGMIELRVDMIVVACALIDFLLKKYTFQKIRVSSYALKEGVLADIMGANPD